jgi:competence protein ComEA
MFAKAKLLVREVWCRDHLRVRLLAVLSVLFAALAAGAGWAVLRPTSSAAPAVARGGVGAALDPAEPALALVFVSGAVLHPGLYHLSPGARIADAIAAAGGITPDADPSRLPNLAARIHDGHQVNVPFRRSTGGTWRAVDKLDVNSATLDQLRAVPGMPLGLAEAIIDYRQLFGPFRSLSDLRQLLGINGPTLTGLRPHLRVVPVSP